MEGRPKHLPGAKAAEAHSVREGLPQLSTCSCPRGVSAARNAPVKWRLAQGVPTKVREFRPAGVILQRFAPPARAATHDQQ